MKNILLTPVASSMYLGAITVNKQTPTVAVRQPVHQFFIGDKSGSMYSTLPKLIEDLKRQARGLQIGDALTFGWFSSKGEFGFPIKAFRIVDANSYLELDRLFDMHREAMNLTCFSDALAEVGKILDETAFLNARNCLTFFSDGWANDSSVETEQRKTREIMRELNGRFDLVLTVAYSDYADRAFLAEMAMLAGGETISAARLENFSDGFARFLARSEKSEPRIKIELGAYRPDFLFAVNANPENGGITMYEQTETGDVLFAPNADYPLEYLYFLTVRGANFYEGVFEKNHVTQIDLQNELRHWQSAYSDDTHHGLLAAAYGAAMVLSKNGRQDDALEVLSYIGDKPQVDNLARAFTPTERGSAELKILDESIFRATSASFENRQFNCLPERDAFCQMELLDLLVADESVLIHPRHPEFKYKKIGRGSTQREGYPMFIADAGATSSLSNISWNEELLNLSIDTRIAGTVELPEQITVNADGKVDPEGLTTIKRPATLPEIFPTFISRKYALIKDGFPNVEQLPISCSPELAARLMAKGIFMPIGVYPQPKPFGVVHLSKLPIINKLIADNVPTAEWLADSAYSDEKYSAALKVYKALRLELDPKGEIIQKSAWTPDEDRFLKALGFSDSNTYSPLSDKLPATDYYDATSFKISISGFSSFPKLSELREKLKAGKTLTERFQAMNVALENFEAENRHSSISEKLIWLDEKIGEVRRTQTILRNDMQRPKLAMILGHRWFPDIAPGTDEIFIEISDTVKAKIVIGKKRVSI